MQIIEVGNPLWHTWRSESDELQLETRLKTLRSKLPEMRKETKCSEDKRASKGKGSQKCGAQKGKVP